MSGPSHPDPQLSLARRLGFGRLIFLTQEAVVAADAADQRIILWNPAAERLFGYSVEEAVGMPISNLVPPELRDAHLAGITRYAAGGEPVLVDRTVAELEAVCKDGSRVDVALTLTAVPSGQGEGDKIVVGIIRDITEQRRAAEALRKANETMKDFVATASHDLRTPLTSVFGFAQILRETPGLSDEERNEFLTIISRSAEAATKLVDDLLTVSNIHADSLSVDPRTLELSTLVPVVETSLGMELETDLEPGLEVVVDPDHLLRILTNLVSNASKYGGTPVRLEGERRNGRVEIRVRDQGPGVPAEYRDRLFKRFSRAGTDKSKGTGLGLSIVQGLAEANGGEAFFEPADPGSIFGVRLPTADSRPQPSGSGGLQA